MHQLSKTFMVRRPRRLVVAGASFASLAILAACSDSAGVGVGQTPSELGFTTGSAASTNVASAAAAPITSAGHTLNITQATLTIARAELKRAQSDTCQGEQEDEDDGDRGGSSGKSHDSCAELKVGPTTIDLPLDGKVVTLPADAIPAGTFRELELRVSQVRLKGTFDTTSFDVTLPLNVRGEIEFSTPLVVTEGAPTTITVNVPVSSWLTNADGSLVDPSKLPSNSSALAQVRARILASFRAFEDKDHDGRDDHGRHGDHGNDG